MDAEQRLELIRLLAACSRGHLGEYSSGES